MIIDSAKLTLFKNLSQEYYGEKYYDFHNDFICKKITFVDDNLRLLFKKISGENVLFFEFKNITFQNSEFDLTDTFEDLTIDNVYRGRFEINGILAEFLNDGRGYFYLEFYEGIKMEFWSESLHLWE